MSTGEYCNYAVNIKLSVVNFVLKRTRYLEIEEVMWYNIMNICLCTGRAVKNMERMVPVIGLCGRSGSGKTTVCKAFEKFGVKSVDTDQVYRELTRPADDGLPSELVRAIAREFGGNVIASDGSLNRTVLAQEVFGDGNGERLVKLNSITHTPILVHTEELIAEYAADGAAGVIVDAPALFESGFDKKCDAILCISAPDEVLIERITERDSISRDAAKRRLSSQIPDSELRRRADHVIENDGKRDLSEEAKTAFSKIFHR